MQAWRSGRILRYRLVHPRRPMYYLGTLVHPSSYLFCTKYLGAIRPNCKQLAPPIIAKFNGQLADVFAAEVVDNLNSLVVDVGWCTRDGEVEHDHGAAVTILTSASLSAKPRLSREVRGYCHVN